MLRVSDLWVAADKNKILRGVNFTLKAGETVALMGPNGSGKSTLAQLLMGHPGYKVEKGQVLFHGQNILALKPEERAKLGLFLAWQYPQEVPGVTIGHFLRLAYNATHQPELSVLDFLKFLKTKLALLDIPEEMIRRSVNEGFSGGEKKRLEILQLAVLGPQLAILDETDSGLDIDALKIVAQGIASIKKTNPKMTMLVITHHQKILQQLVPDRVLVMKKGQIVREGDLRLLSVLEEKGYQAFH